MSINLASIYQQLFPGLMAVDGKYKEVPLELDKLFVTRQSIMNMERSLQSRFLGIAALKADGGGVTYENGAGDRFIYNMQPVGAGIGYVMTRNALADGLYKDSFMPSNLGMQNAMRAFWNTQAAYLLNTASTYNANLGGDGVALLSTAHPLDVGTWANTSSTPQSLSEASLVSAIKAVPKTFVDQAGLFIDVTTENLVIPWAQRDVALRLIKSELRPGTANNDPNIIPMLHGGIKEIITSRYLTSDYPWFLTTSVKGFIKIEREPFESDMNVDFDTDNLKVKCYERAGYFYNDPRCVYGQMATA